MYSQYYPFLAPVHAQGIRTYLTSAAGVVWKIKPQSDLTGDSTKIFDQGYNTGSWIKATVPGTVFASYCDAGIEKDPNYADNIYNVDKKKYDRNFWYRTEFKVFPEYAKNKVWLNFHGVNRDAGVWLNGVFLGKIEGFVQRGKFDITGYLKKNGANVLAVLVYVPHTPLSNGASPHIPIQCGMGLDALRSWLKQRNTGQGFFIQFRAGDTIRSIYTNYNSFFRFS